MLSSYMYVGISKMGGGAGLLIFFSSHLHISLQLQRKVFPQVEVFKNKHWFILTSEQLAFEIFLTLNTGKIKSMYNPISSALLTYFLFQKRMFGTWISLHVLSSFQFMLKLSKWKHKVWVKALVWFNSKYLFSFSSFTPKIW